MPELPEVESIVRALRPYIIGKTICQVEVFDPRLLENTTSSVLQTTLVNQTINQIQRRGKFILFSLSNNYKLTTHLRMTGNYLYFSQQSASDKHTRMVISFADSSQLHYRDLRRFGRLTLYPIEAKIKVLEKLGPEPLDTDFSPEYLQERTGQRKIAIKQLLLDQSIVAGIGNIYASEILFAAAISPFKPANQLKTAEFKRLVQAIRDILNKAVQCLGTTFSDYRTPNGETGNFQGCLNVYGRADQPCANCNTSIQKAFQAQRSTFFCPHCQP